MNHVRRFVLSMAISLMLGVPFGPAQASPRCEGLFRTSAALDFHGREDLLITPMKPSLVKSRVTGSIQRFVDTLESVRSAIRGLRVPKTMTKTVLYPMSGYDLTTPLRLFPDSETYVLVDNHSLMRASEVGAFARRKLETDYRDRNNGWVDYKETGHDVFSKLMASLFATLPSAKISSIEFITDASENVSVKIVALDVDRSQVKTIFYLAGEIGSVLSKVRNSAHANGATNSDSMEHPAGNWWDDMLAEIAPRALLLKGSMSALRQTVYDDLLLGRERILRPTFESGGVIVEGASRMRPDEDAKWAQRLKPERDRWELSDGDPRLQEAVREQILRNIEFSYSSNVRIAVYDPQAQPKSRRGP